MNAIFSKSVFRNILGDIKFDNIKMSNPESFDSLEGVAEFFNLGEPIKDPRIPNTPLIILYKNGRGEIIVGIGKTTNSWNKYLVTLHSLTLINFSLEADNRVQFNRSVDVGIERTNFYELKDNTVEKFIETLNKLGYQDESLRGVFDVELYTSPN